MISYFSPMETLKAKSKDLLDTLVNLVYPNICVVCKKELDQDIYPLCRQCMKDIKTIEPPRCIKCGRHLPVEGVCGECAGRKAYFDRAWAATLYDGVMKECIHNFKYKNKLRLIRVFKKFILEFSIESLFIQDIDVIVPVPLRPAKTRERSYNQSAILASEIAGAFSIPLDAKSLKKTKNTRPQNTLDRSGRLKNVKGSFAVKKSHRLGGKRVLLVDDVFTTGATLNECAKVLKEAGAGTVSVFALARGA